jgi:hypothetical protein
MGRRAVGDKEEGDAGDAGGSDGDALSVEGEEHQDGSLFGATLQKLVRPAPSGGAGESVLSKRKTKELREIEQERRAAKKQRLERKLRKASKDQGLVEPALADVAFERELRKVATRGVVALFNAIQTHQASAQAADKDRSAASAKEAASAASKRKAMRDVKEVSKDAFLDILKKAGKAPEGMGAGAEAKRSGWNVLRDDYGMVATKMTDFEREEEANDDEGEREVEEYEEEDEED